MRRPPHHSLAEGKRGIRGINTQESSSLPWTVVVLVPPESLVATEETGLQRPDHSTTVPAAIGSQVAVWQAHRPGSAHTCHLLRHGSGDPRPSKPGHSRAPTTLATQAATPTTMGTPTHTHCKDANSSGAPEIRKAQVVCR